MSKQTVTINGVAYDAQTGMPIDPTATQPSTPKAKLTAAKPSQSVHKITQKSQTLNRRIVKKTTAAQDIQPIKQTVEKSPHITRFAPHPAAVKPQTRAMSDIGPVQHPLAAKANQKLQKAAESRQAAPAPKPAHLIKDEAIRKALANAASKSTAQHRTKKRYSRPFSITSAALALIFLGGYFTYLNMPSLSVRVAAAQAGVNATYPEYRPDGYSLNGPVAYTQGEVTMKFAANAGPQNFTITQEKSDWDSSAVLDNYVKEKAGTNYIAYSERGLTIYTFDGNAAWVNDGILYKISGDAPLAGDQVRHIATSM